mgnify:CR=1 FL=1
MKEKNISIRSASIGNISKKNLVDAETNYDTDPLTSVILGFNITCELPPPERVKVLTNKVIYTLLEDFEKWKEQDTGTGREEDRTRAPEW